MRLQWQNSFWITTKTYGSEAISQITHVRNRNIYETNYRIMYTYVVIFKVVFYPNSSCGIFRNYISYIEHSPIHYIRSIMLILVSYGSQLATYTRNYTI